MPAPLPLRLTLRDQDILGALTQSPLTVRQILKLSVTFTLPFLSERRVQERLHQLALARLVRAWPYATATAGGALLYYTLTPGGYRVFFGDEAPPPPRGLFRAVGLSRQEHTRKLADFLVHTFVAAKHAGIPVEDVHRENALKLAVEGQCLFPDSAFTLRRKSDGRGFRYFVEIDNATQPIKAASLGSWDGKLRFYERYRDYCRKTSQDDAFRVLVLSAGTAPRVQHILDAAAHLMVRKERSIFYGVPLAAYLEHQAPLTTTLFLDNLGRVIPLLPPLRQPVRVAEPVQALVTPAEVC